MRETPVEPVDSPNKSKKRKHQQKRVLNESEAKRRAAKNKDSAVAVRHHGEEVDGKGSTPILKKTREKRDQDSVSTRGKKKDVVDGQVLMCGKVKIVKQKPKKKKRDAGKDQALEKLLLRRKKGGDAEQQRPDEEFLDDNEFPMAECDIGNENAGETIVKKHDVFEVDDIKYIALQSLQGSFGTVDVAENSPKGKRMKLRVESSASRCKRMKTEEALLELVAAIERDRENPMKQLVAKGQKEKIRFLVLNTVGPTLSDLWKKNNERFSVPAVLHIGIATVTCIEEIHRFGFLHRDIKPQVFSLSTDFRLVLTHFGLARKYLRSIGSPSTISFPPRRRSPHIESRGTVLFLGSMRYASRSAHLRVERSRRDDVESWFYMMTELWSGPLLWKDEPDQDKVFEAKNAVFSEGGFDMLRTKFAGYPDEYKLIMRYVSSIDHHVAPDYKFLRQEHRDTFYRRFNAEVEDCPFDLEKSGPELEIEL